MKLFWILAINYELLSGGMMFTFISDLDHTLIYSHQKEGTCVEFLDGQGLTYMTPAAKNDFYELLEQKDFLFIPCTARNFQQASRVEFVKEVPYMICDLGGSIYANGKLDDTWTSILRERNYSNSIAIETEKEWIQTYLNIPYIKLHCTQDLFFVLVFKDKEVAGMAWKKIKRRKNPNIKYHLQGRKIYCIPVRLDKMNAVKYLMEQYHIENVYTSGDSVFDEAFTKIGTSLLPAHATMVYKTGYRTKETGMQGGEELIKQLKELYGNAKKILPY